MNTKELRKNFGDTQSDFSMRYGIPFRTIQNWETGKRKPPKYVEKLLEERINRDLYNRKTIVLPSFDVNKINLPNRKDYVSSIAWLKAIKESVKENIVFALDEALMCDGSFQGRNDEFIIWAYGNNSLERYNGIALLGNHVSINNVKEKHGLMYTDFNRTVYDSLANEEILDMQGITEALSRYYYSNSDSFKGLFIPPEYQDQFNKITEDAIEYYNSI